MTDMYEKQREQPQLAACIASDAAAAAQRAPGLYQEVEGGQAMNLTVAGVA